MQPAEGRLGVLVVGLGAVSSTLIAGVANLIGLRATKAGRYRLRITAGGLSLVFTVSVRGRRLS